MKWAEPLAYPPSAQWAWWWRTGSSPPNGSTAGEGAATLGLGFDIGQGEHWTFRLDGRYLQGPSDESGAICKTDVT